MRFCGVGEGEKLRGIKGREKDEDLAHQSGQFIIKLQEKKNNKTVVQKEVSVLLRLDLLKTVFSKRINETNVMGPVMF